TDRNHSAEFVVDVVPGVGGVGAVVPHDPDESGLDVDVEGHGGGRGAGEDVGALAERDAVDGDPALLVAALDLVAGDADDPLDQVVLAGRGQQADEGERVGDPPHREVGAGR